MRQTFYSVFSHQYLYFWMEFSTPLSDFPSGFSVRQVIEQTCSSSAIPVVRTVPEVLRNVRLYGFQSVQVVADHQKVNNALAKHVVLGFRNNFNDLSDT